MDWYILGGCIGRGQESGQGRGRDDRIIFNNYTLPNTSTVPVLNNTILENLGVTTGGGNVDINSSVHISGDPSSDDEDDGFVASGSGSGYPTGSRDADVLFENM